jgi:hypothetical protein
MLFLLLLLLLLLRHIFVDIHMLTIIHALRRSIQFTSVPRWGMTELQGAISSFRL